MTIYKGLENKVFTKFTNIIKCSIIATISNQLLAIGKISFTNFNSKTFFTVIFSDLSYTIETDQLKKFKFISISKSIITPFKTL